MTNAKQMAANPDKLSQFWQELKRRKVIKVIAMYAATAFIIMEAGDIMLPRLGLPDWTVTFIIILLIVGFPITIILSWIFDVTHEGIKKTESVKEVKKQEPTPSPIKRRLKASDIIIVVLVVAVIILLYPRLFISSPSLKAMTRPVTIVNELGEKEIRRVLKEDYVSKLAIFPFTNESDDPSEDWLQYGIFDAIREDLLQFNYIITTEDTDATNLQGQIKFAKTSNSPHFLIGAYRISEGIYDITSRLYQTSNGAIKETRNFKGSDFFSLIDSISTHVRIDLGIPNNLLNSYSDLPISEQLTKNLDAFRYFELGNIINNKVIKDRNDSLPGSNYINWNKAIELDSTFAIALWRSSYNNALYQRNPESASKLINQAMRHRSRLSEASELQIQTLYHSIYGEHEKAVALAEMQYDLQPYNFRVLEQLIDTYRINFMVHKVEKAVQQLNDLVPNLPEYQILLARSCLYAGNLKQGLKVIERVLEENPENTDALLQLGEIYLHKDDLESAERAYRKAILLSPENKDQWSKLLDHITYRRIRPVTEEFLQAFTGSFIFDRNSEQNFQLFIHNNYLVSKPDQQRGSFYYPISDSVFVSDKAWSTNRYHKNDKGKISRIIHDQENLDFSPIYWKEDSVILKAMDYMNTGRYSKALSAFHIAYDQNPEHYYLSNYIQHLEYIQSQEYEKSKLVLESYTGDYGTQKIFLENDQFYYETIEGFIFKLFPLNEEQFMNPGRINSLIQIEKESDRISGLSIYYRHGEQEFYPRSLEQALASHNN